MALANVAFIAAMNGKRVLVMDWDLEAPGLAYYFRGLLDPQKDRALKDTRGLLNVLWQWKSTASGATREEVQGAFQEFAEGAPFQDCSVSLVPNDRLPPGASLDYISAGSKYVDETNRVSYEDALAGFSWQEFFERFAGGAILESLRNWCKRNYDFIFVDSRTGLADVAGICTMQLPDEVLMCFVLNRQNIDGTARVAQAIREKRGEQVRLRAIPMRTSRERTSEESDATARASIELKRIGGFSSEALLEDFKFAVRATEGVPFYETLSPLLPQTPAIEVFSANYRQLASEIVGAKLEIPGLDAEWASAVRRRLLPRHATVDFVRSLENAEPARAAEELHRLLESAQEEEFDGGGLDDAYVETLIEVAISGPFDIDSGGQAADLADAALDLLRMMYRSNREKWAGKLVDTIEHYLEDNSYLLDESRQVDLLEEIDSVLSSSETAAVDLRRLDLRRNIAEIYLDAEQMDAFVLAANDAWKQAENLRKKYVLDSEQSDVALFIEANLGRLEAEWKTSSGDLDGALNFYDTSLAMLDRLQTEGARSEAVRMAAAMHSQASLLYDRLGEIESAVGSSIRSAELAGRVNGMMGRLFRSLLVPVLKLGDEAVAVEFGYNALLKDAPRSVNSIVSLSSRAPQVFKDLIDKLASLVRLVKNATDSRVPALLRAISSILIKSVPVIATRRWLSHSLSSNGLRESIETFLGELEFDSMSEAQRSEWDEVLRALDRSSPKKSQAPE